MSTPKKLWKLAVTGLIAASFGFSAAGYADDYHHDHDNNPPGPAGGPGTNWENPPGPAGGPGASPDRRPDRVVPIRHADQHFRYVENGYYFNQDYGYWHPDRGFWNQKDRCWWDRDDNPPGPAGGPGTNWENPPGYRGGPGASPDRYGHCK